MEMEFLLMRYISETPLEILFFNQVAGVKPRTPCGAKVNVKPNDISCLELNRGRPANLAM
jgi:hypothetical protein